MFGDMATRRAPAKRQRHAPPEKKSQFNVRLQPSLHDALLAWLDESNETRRVPWTQSELVRAALEWCVQNKPKLDVK